MVTAFLDSSASFSNGGRIKQFTKMVRRANSHCVRDLVAFLIVSTMIRRQAMLSIAYVGDSYYTNCVRFCELRLTGLMHVCELPNRATADRDERAAEAAAAAASASNRSANREQ